jgi:cytochrome c-type biogenesis protein CcmH/NrfG
MNRLDETTGENTAGTPSEAELFARLGLTSGASNRDVETAHDEIIAFVARAPEDLRAWAERQTAVADEAYTRLSGDSAAEAPSVTPAAVTPPPSGPVDAPQAPAGPRSRRRRLIVAGATAIALAAVGFGVYSLGGDKKDKGSAATPATTQTTATPVDSQQVAQLMEKISTNPKDVKSLVKLGDVYFQAGDYETAAKWMTKVVDLQPRNTTALLALGAVRFNVGKTAEAERHWRKVAEIAPKNVEAHYDLGFLYLSKNPPDMAKVKAEWNQVVALDPGSDVAKTISAHLSQLGTSPTGSTTGK